MINRVVLVGRLTKEVELRKTQSGAQLYHSLLRATEDLKQEGQPDADFINCVAWNKVADLMAQYLKKGALIGVEGRIQTRSYDGQDGKRVYVTEVVADSVQFLEPKGTSQQPSYSSNQSYQSGYTPDEPRSSFENEFAGDTLDIASDDLPF